MIEVETFIMNKMHDYWKKTASCAVENTTWKYHFVRESPTEDEESSQKTIAEVLKQKLIIHNNSTRP
jgi:hypothetical protein